eukprot:6489552-Amphidinium_carterae.1
MELESDGAALAAEEPGQEAEVKKKRGRPKGAATKKKDAVTGDASVAGESKAGENPPPKEATKYASKEKATKTHIRCCRGCKKFFMNEGMAVNSSFCLKDNRAMQNIRYMANRQNLLDWFNRMKESDAKLAQTLTAYHQRNPDQVSAGVKRQKTSSATTL